MTPEAATRIINNSLPDAEIHLAAPIAHALNALGLLHYATSEGPLTATGLSLQGKLYPASSSEDATARNIATAEGRIEPEVAATARIVSGDLIGQSLPQQETAVQRAQRDWAQKRQRS